MAWTLAENVRSILEYLDQAKQLGAEVTLFPECATTGFHRQVPEQTTREGIEQALECIRLRCAALELSAIVGTPFFPAAHPLPLWNAAVVIGAGGERLAISPKAGLTASERTFFQAGDTRPTFTLGSTTCAVLLCREVRDAAQLSAALAGVQVVFWPGAIRWSAAESDPPENVVTPEIASACAARLGVYLVQCNWPYSLNTPMLGNMGGSLVFSPTGAILHRCPLEEPGISVVTLELAGVQPLARTPPA